MLVQRKCPFCHPNTLIRGFAHPIGGRFDTPSRVSVQFSALTLIRRFCHLHLFLLLQQGCPPLLILLLVLGEGLFVRVSCVLLLPRLKLLLPLGELPIEFCFLFGLSLRVACFRVWGIVQAVGGFTWKVAREFLYTVFPTMFLRVLNTNKVCHLEFFLQKCLFYI